MKDKDPYSPSSYFTYQELYEVYRRVTSPGEAADMARSSASDPAHDEELLRLEEAARSERDSARVAPVEAEHQRRQALAHRTIPTAVLTDDTVIMLSLLSPDAEARAHAYRRALLGGRSESPDEQRAWHERRQEIKAWADAGYPLDQA